MMNLYNWIKKAVIDSDVGQRILRAIAFGLGGAIGSRVLMTLSGMIISQMLGAEVYGQFSLLNSTVTTFVSFSGWGLGATLTRYVALYKNGPKELGHIAGTLKAVCAILSVAMAASVFFFSSELSLWVNGDLFLTDYFRLTAATIFFAAMSFIEQSVMVGLEKYKKIGGIQLIYGGAYLILSTTLSWQFGINGAIISLLASHALQYILMRHSNEKEFKQRKVKVRIQFTGAIWKIIWKFTLPAFISSLFATPVLWVTNSLLAKNAGFTELAIYAVAYQWMLIINFIPAQMSQIRPIYTELYADGKYDELKSTLVHVTAISSGVVMPVVVLAIVAGKFILGLYGGEYVSGYYTFILMVIAAAIINVQSQIGCLLQSIGEMWYGFALDLIWVISIMAVFCALQNLGSLGLAIAYCVSYGVKSVFAYALCVFLWKKERGPQCS